MPEAWTDGAGRPMTWGVVARSALGAMLKTGTVCAALAVGLLYFYPNVFADLGAYLRTFN